MTPLQYRLNQFGIVSSSLENEVFVCMLVVTQTHILGRVTKINHIRIQSNFTALVFR